MKNKLLNTSIYSLSAFSIFCTLCSFFMGLIIPYAFGTKTLNKLHLNTIVIFLTIWGITITLGAFLLLFLYFFKKTASKTIHFNILYWSMSITFILLCVSVFVFLFYSSIRTGGFSPI